MGSCRYFIWQRGGHASPEGGSVTIASTRAASLQAPNETMMRGMKPPY